MNSHDPFERWYSVQAIAERFVTGLEAVVAERTIRYEIERQPILLKARVHKFGRVFLPWSVLKQWLQISEPPPAPPRPALSPPIVARNEAELTRKLRSGRLHQEENHHGG